jgi:taurine---2-oxoglutarate transaminase
VVIERAIADTFRDRVYQGGLTYSGHPLACAAAVASINIFEEEGILDNARTIGGTVLGPRLRELAAKHDVIGEVRGLGVFWAMELVSDRAARTPADVATMQRFVAGCKQRGVWPFMAANRIHVVPPCTISVEDAHTGLDVMDEVLATL